MSTTTFWTNPELIDQVTFKNARFTNLSTYEQDAVCGFPAAHDVPRTHLWPAATKERTVEVSPAATVIFNRVLLRKDLYRDDMMQGWPDQIDLVQAMLFAHEATHVWQWQNRNRTGYHPIKALSEHATSADPYLFDTEADAEFFSFGCEQQGSIVQEYVCYTVLDPDGPRIERLRRMISQHMPIDGLDAA